MEPFDIALRAWVLLFSVLLFLFGMMAYQRYKTPRLALILSIFSLFVIKGAILVLAVIPEFRDLNLLVTEVWFHLTFDSLVLMLIFLTLTGKQRAAGGSGNQDGV